MGRCTACLSRSRTSAEAVKALGGGVRGLRIGVDHAYALERTDPTQARAIEAALRLLERQGAVITPVRMPDLSDVVPTWMTICGFEMAAAHAATYPSRAGGDPGWPITHAIQTGSMAPYHQAWSAAQPRNAEFTMPMDLAGVPAICLPCGFSPDGLPYSIQFTGRRLSEAMLCRVAYAYEQATDWRTRHPSMQA